MGGGGAILNQFEGNSKYKFGQGFEFDSNNNISVAQLRGEATGTMCKLVARREEKVVKGILLGHGGILVIPIIEVFQTWCAYT